MLRRTLASLAAALLLAACTPQTEAEKAAAENLEKSEDFLAENGKREGVTVTQSGLQYEVVREGSGPQPTLADRVTVNYEGKLIDGTVFDSSYSRGEPATFPLAGVVPGWREGVRQMKVGSEYNLYLPPDLGYGEQDKGNIPPNSALIFRVELLGIE